MEQSSVLKKELGITASLLALGVFFSGLTPTGAQQTSSGSPVLCQHIVRHDPNYSIYVVKVDLRDPRVAVRVSRGGPDPDGDGPWLTTLLPASEIAQREHFDIAINGDFFQARATTDIEGKHTGYVRGKFAAPEGPAMTDGQLWHGLSNACASLEITSSNTAMVVEERALGPVDPNARQILGGRPVLVRHGEAVSWHSKLATARHPRSAVGVNRNGTELTLFVVDGRQPGLSIGMTLDELSQEMIRLGCDNALNLDGGGSTTLVYREPATHQLKVVNSPSDTRERSIADVLGIVVKAPLPSPD